jgi:hypothetical protein
MCDSLHRRLARGTWENTSDLLFDSVRVILTKE